MNPIIEDHSQATIGAPAQTLPVNRPTLDQIKARIRRYNADLPPSSPTFEAAVILLAGLEFGHNIDMLARRTGYDRGFVARCARRLTDNGVWKQDRTNAEWSQADEASGTFWNDVAVAEGHMCRRVHPDGHFEWAPAGYWNKSYLSADPAAQDHNANTYLDATQAEPPPGPAAAEAAAKPTDAPPDPSNAPNPPDTHPSVDAIGADNSPAAPPPSLGTAFHDVVWIS
ncbi:MAG: hypothetical protein L0271_05865 [Gemmatimonadetes bacterium]|nr:hypothetical protein [Gemmatimonadota bacterium]